MRQKWLLILTGIIVGGLSILLVAQGNPANMGFCIACFLRDIAGGLGLHRAGVVPVSYTHLDVYKRQEE